jgi:hypothetical protein
MMTYNHSNDDWAGPLIGAILMWLWLILVGAWVLSRWLTEQLFKHVLNPLLDHALDRHDGLIILLSAGLWGALFPVLLIPGVEAASPEELWQATLVLFGLGLAWGSSIGCWILAIWWDEAERRQPAYEPAQLLGSPVKLVSSPHSNGNQPLPSREELRSEVENIFVRVAEKERV